MAARKKKKKKKRGRTPKKPRPQGRRTVRRKPRRKTSRRKTSGRTRKKPARKTSRRKPARRTRKTSGRTRRKPRRKTSRRKTAPRAARRPRRGWVRLPIWRLLEVRLCDLDLRLEGTLVGQGIARVRRELAGRGLRFQPYFWISDEWFTPDGSTGTAVPFYLLHPRLVRLEREMTGEAEGSTRAWCLKIIRHEVGHALRHAYRLNRRRRWRQLFGSSTRPYPRQYQPNPYSRRHVQHLEYWYAQSHPDEDFAETFAVWLAGPRRVWRKRYADWPALKKLEYVDELMRELAGERPQVRTHGRVEPISTMRRTLRGHYDSRRLWGAPRWPDVYDRDLQRLFRPPRGGERSEAASAFIGRARRELLRRLAPWIGEHRYQLELAVREMTGRCRELGLRAAGSSSRLTDGLVLLLVKYTMDALYRRRGRIEL